MVSLILTSSSSASLRFSVYPGPMGSEEPNMIKGKWIDAYKKAIIVMKPGLNEMIVHLAANNDEMSAITAGHNDYGSAWRQHDLDLVVSREFKNLLKNNNIILIGWKPIKDLMNREAVK